MSAPLDRRVRLLTCFLATVAFCPLTPANEVRFNRDVRPILAANCYPCHGPDKDNRKADLRLDTSEGIEHAFAGGLADNEAWSRITSEEEDVRMPPPAAHRELTAEQIATLKSWIADGAPWEGHWSFVPPTRPAIPRLPDESRVVNPIDAFVQARLAEHNLIPADQADRERLIRRVSLDLTGLPPTLAEIDSYMNDPSAQAYETVVDRLLNSPHFGERMALAWLDAARYGDTSVFHGDGHRDMWPWRDYVIDAYNHNLSFADFTREQLAGDLLHGATISQRVASGFNRNNATTDEGGAIDEEFRVEYAVDRVKTTSLVWLGLTMECAQCHDHKYDPISQREYYQFYAYFNQASDPGMQTRNGNQAPVAQVTDGARLARAERLKSELPELNKRVAEAKTSALAEFPRWLTQTEQTGLDLPAPTEDSALHASFDESEGNPFPGSIDEARVYARPLSPNEVQALAADSPLRSILVIAPSRRTAEQRDQLRDYYLDQIDQPYQAARAELQRRTEEIAALEKPVSSVMVMQDVEQPRMTFVLERGNYNAPQQDRPVKPSTLRALPPLPTAPGNRLGLAEWLLQPNHPLTARVAVNRYWYLLFGTGLVKTVEDFGSQGEWPSHPDLLDWLAVDFRESGWDIKRMIKQMVMSWTYRQSAAVSSELLQRDPENRWLARGPRFRLQAEFIRDNALSASGLLVPRIGGPSVKPYQPEGLWNEVSIDTNLRFQQDHGDKLYRRGMYTYWKRSAPAPSLAIFDTPTRDKCLLRRARTNTPLQALVTLNDVQYVEAARALAERAWHEGGDSLEDRILHAYRLATGSRPAAETVKHLKQTFEEERKVFADEPNQAKQLLETGESQRDEQIDEADHAAMTIVASIILNLDETLTRG